jgi:hypothetical protein
MFFCFNYNCTRDNMLFVVETQNLRHLLNINKRIKAISWWLIKIDILAQFSLTIEYLKWFCSIMWVKRMHTISTNKSQYFVAKVITRRLRDERTKKDFYFSKDFSFIYIVYNKMQNNHILDVIII